MLHTLLQQRLQQAVIAALPGADTAALLVRPCPDSRFGDYQTNALISLAKTHRMNPRQLAADVVSKLDVSPWCEPAEIAGAGFLNFRLKPAALAQTLLAAVRGEHLFFAKASPPRTIVIDFSSPNVAKPMHVGHIRSTGIGDCLQRVLRLLGHRVVTDNHIGDWGTQFGMLLHGWQTLLDRSALERDSMFELERIYKRVQSTIRQEITEEIKRRCPTDLQQALAGGIQEDNAVEKVLATIPTDQALELSLTEVASRKELVKLQAGDPDNLAIWREMLRLSQTQFDAIYGRLGVKFDHSLGESFYNPQLGNVVANLLERGIARESEGAVGVFSDGSLPPKEDPFLVNRDGEWVPDPALVRKRDGGFNYMTTDLATLDYRLKTWSPDEILYVVDDRQAAHFRKLFLAFARWQPDAARRVKLRHVGFGKILGDDGRPYKTRSGDTVKLSDLLDEAEQRALAVVKAKQLERPDSERVPESSWPEVARVVGLGAVKYADLLPNRQSDYVFSWDKMLALNGNTAPYLQYAYARIRSIFRKADSIGDWQAAIGTLALSAPEELALARHLLNFGLVLEAVAEECRPNFLCNYLYELAGHFARFYEACPVLKAGDAERSTRLALCELTGRVLQQGLHSLGIEVLDQM
jgi:arginyl-tRNA synthetase